MSSIYFGSGANVNYIVKALPWLCTVNEFSPFHNFFVCVDTNPIPELVAALPRISFIPMSIRQDQAPAPNFCLQHGSFLDPSAIPNDAIVIYTDGDLAMQRPPMAEETARLEALDDGEAMLGWNRDDRDTLLWASELQQPTLPLGELDRRFGNRLGKMPVYNTGVLIARASTYRCLYRLYVANYSRIDGLFKHYAKQQWLLCFLLDTEGFKVTPLDWDMHAHGHLGLPPDMQVRENKVTYRGKPVWLRHKLGAPWTPVDLNPSWLPEGIHPAGLRSPRPSPVPTTGAAAAHDQDGPNSKAAGPEPGTEQSLRSAAGAGQRVPRRLRVLLIEPWYGYKEAVAWIPLGKLYLSAVLRDHGFQVRLVDWAKHEVTMQDVAALVREFKPDVVGTGGMTVQSSSTRQLSQMLRQACDPHTLLIGGGIHFTLMPEEGVDLFDLTAVGEGERTMLEVCERFEQMGASKDLAGFRDIPGLCFRAKDGHIERTGEREFIADLDSLPLPALDLIDIHAYDDHLVSGERAVSIMTARGCPFDCEFCASPQLYKRKVRSHSLDYAFEMIDYLNKRTGRDCLRIMDDTFTMDQRRVIEFCDRITRMGKRYNMTCLTHVKVSAGRGDMFRAMKQAGFSIVALGIESGNDSILQLINKRTTTAGTAETIGQIRRAGIAVEGLFMVGNIGETRATIEDSIRFAKEHNPAFSGSRRMGYNWFQFTTPFPGSRLFQEAAKYGTVLPVQLRPLHASGARVHPGWADGS